MAVTALPPKTSLAILSDKGGHRPCPCDAVQIGFLISELENFLFDATLTTLEKSLEPRRLIRENDRVKKKLRESIRPF